MKRLIFSALLLGLASCSTTDSSESLGESEEALNGDLSAAGFLTRKGNLVPSQDENVRRADTLAYYASTNTRLGVDGLGNASIDVALNSLSNFRTFFGFGGGQFAEYAAYYYNKGDLGLGREMHCIDHSSVSTDQQIACYVTNYSSGDDFGEFTFGLSADIAFANMNAIPPRPLATVAMVYRPLARIGLGRDQMLFMAYNATGGLADNAPLDRHGINFANGFAAAGNHTPDAALFGTPAVHFNNHIPSNCLNCHGGTYNPGARNSPSTPTLANALFLPWDLDQLQYQSIPGKTRAAQEGTFRNLNGLARKVAAGGALGAAMVKQIDGWYGNTSPLSGNFVPFAPTGWQGSGDGAVFYDVVRRSCRGCHITSPISFDDASSFLSFAGAAATDLVVDPAVPAKAHSMPHALQAQREFWLSSQPLELENYFRSHGQVSAANLLHGGGPGRIVTLDPFAISAATSF